MKVVEIKWCPTKEMVVDFMTKPLEGSHFRRLCGPIMGMASIKKAKTQARASQGCSKETRQLGSQLVLLVSR